jgi:hypothetical protein
MNKPSVRDKEPSRFSNISQNSNSLVSKKSSGERKRRDSMKASSFKRNSSGMRTLGSEKGSNERSGGKGGFKKIDHVEDGLVDTLKKDGYLDL